MHCTGAKLPKVAEPTGEAYTQAVTTLLPYLLSHRSRLAAFTATQAMTTQASTAATASQPLATAASLPGTASQVSAANRPLHATADSAAHVSDFGEASEAASSSYSEAGQEEEAPGSPMRSRPHEFLASLQPEQRHRLAVLVDTAILKVVPVLLVLALHCSSCSF